MNLQKILVIVGPTASGKTSLSIELAKSFNGEIVSADSRQVYRGLDLGTGKVTREEMRGITHHLLDVVDPETVYTAHDYVRDGVQVINDIHAREKLPIVVGGTFLYVDALMGKISTPEVPPDARLREELEAQDTGTLMERLCTLDSTAAQKIDVHNKRRIIRAIEIASALGSIPSIQNEKRYDALTLGIQIDMETLRKNIHQRLEDRLERGMLSETKALLDRGVQSDRLSELGIEYEYMIKHLHHEISKEEMCREIETKSRQYAKRQMTWLKRDKTITWVDKHDVLSITESVKEFLR